MANQLIQWLIDKESMRRAQPTELQISHLQECNMLM